MKKLFKSNKMNLIFENINDNMLFCGVAPEGEDIDLTPGNMMPPFQMGILGEGYGGGQAMSMAYSNISAGSRIKSFSEDEEMIEMIYENVSSKVEITVKYEKTAGADVVRCRTSVRNIGDKEIILSSLSSAYIPGIMWDEPLEGLDDDRISVNRCINTWEGEGQWRKSTLNEMGVYYATTHSNPANLHFANVGSCSTSKMIPMIIIEDNKKGICWYFQIETSSNWNIEVGYRNEPEQNNGCVYCTLDAANERYGFFTHPLKPGESYTSEPAAFGCCRGGFNDGVRELTKYRRAKVKPANPWQGESPVIFNDYMNALWANPSDTVLVPLIETVATTGVDGFCIDAGWFDKKTDSWGVNLGDWQPSSDRFGEMGLKGILDLIRSRNMIPGLWLEMEVVSKASKLYEKPDDWFICRNGVRVYDAGRYFLDYRNKQVRAYMHSVIDRLVDMGAGYFKNDYNACISIGDTKHDSPAYSLQEHLRGFYSFIEEVKAKHPALILENCGGGAMREDNGILSHFHLQSVSDQEDFRFMPAIVSGSLAAVLPEQLGIWAYPISLRYKVKDTPDVLKTDEYKQRFADGEETIFNMVTGMAGNLYLSGRLEYADDKNLELIREGVGTYKSLRGFIHNAFPVLPCGFNRIEKHESFDVLMMQNEEKTEALLYVWRKEGADDEVCVPLDTMKDKNLRIEIVYPVGRSYNTDFSYDAENANLNIKMGKKNSARLFRIS